VKVLVEKVSINDQPKLLFAFADHVMSIEFQEILMGILKKGSPTKETMNLENDHGFTPFLVFIDRFLV